MKKSKLFVYEGTNDEMSVKQSMEGYTEDSEIIVPETHYAFVVKEGVTGPTLDSGRHKIVANPKKFLFFCRKIEKGEVDVIYISKTYKLQVFWGTNEPFDYRDTETGLPIHINVRGEITLQVSNPRQFVDELVGFTRSYETDDLKNYLKAQLLTQIKASIARLMREGGVSYTSITENLMEFTKALEPDVFELVSRYGLKPCSFIVEEVKIPLEEKQRIEAALEEVKAEILRKAELDLLKKEAREIAAELERLDDKNFERQMRLRELESRDYDKYLDVIKHIGTQPVVNTQVGKGARYCTKCGHSFENGDMYCPGCGAKVGEGKVICPHCKKENSAKSKFCSGCGKKI